MQSALRSREAIYLRLTILGARKIGHGAVPGLMRPGMDTEGFWVAGPHVGGSQEHLQVGRPALPGEPSRLVNCYNYSETMTSLSN